MPDIALPFAYPISELGEQYYSQALGNTTLEKASYYRPQAELPVAALAKKSQSRQEHWQQNRTSSPVFDAQSPSYLQQLPLSPKDGSEQNSSLFQQLEQDIYLQEAFQIMSDWLSVSKP